MKKINLSMGKCVNPKCKRGILSESVMNKCPICNSKLVKDKYYVAQGLFDENEKVEGYVVLKDKGNKNDNRRPRTIKKK